jgi:sphingomyelin phosphodiesterase
MWLFVSVALADGFSIAPCNLFPTPIIRTDNISWLYQALADSWIDTFGLPNHTRESILQGGFYTTLVRSGLRLISLNTNYYASDNYWLFLNSTDPLNQLEWVSSQMRNKKIVRVFP